MHFVHALPISHEIKKDSVKPKKEDKEIILQPCDEFYLFNRQRDCLPYFHLRKELSLLPHIGR